MPTPVLHPLTREEIAKIEIGKTDVSPRLARAITWSFIVFLFTVPLVQQIIGRAERDMDRAAAAIPFTHEIAPRFIDAWNAGWRGEGTLLDQAIAVNENLLDARDTWEDNFVDRSWLSETLLPPVQTALYALGTGNDKAVVGRNGWLFYVPGIEYLTGPGFLTDRHLRPRDITGNLKHSPAVADPRNAILEFHGYLASRGIQLVLVPAPDKAMIEPDRLSRRVTGRSEVLQNPSFERFREQIEQEGVLVFDPASELPVRARETGSVGQEQRIGFLRTDSHWRPAAMERVARRLAGFLEKQTALGPRSIRYGRGRHDISASGDLALMLRMPRDRTPVERTVVHPVVDPRGGPWSASPASEILFLGDSYANIFSLAGMGWGEGAGFPEQLSYFLGRPLDTILRNDAGAHATREMLAADLMRGEDRLAGKKVVVWEFAIRELSAGQWKSIPMAAAPPQVRPAEMPGQAVLVVRGRVGSAAEVPRPGQVPYKDHIRALHLVDVQALTGTLEETDIVVYTWSMRDNELTPEAHLTEGSAVTLRLLPWSDAPGELERINRSELEDDELLFYDPWWGEMIDEDDDAS